MTEQTFSIKDLWKITGFTPNSQQKEAILHTEGPLYLTAGPGSGKTRVLLWRTLNLIVFHNVKPEEIYLSTFTEKAALQLREGLQAMLSIASTKTDKPYDLAQMYVGTVHSLCQRMLIDRRFSKSRQRTRAPRLLDELGQYFFIYRNRNWTQLTASAGLTPGANKLVNSVFKLRSQSRHRAVTNCMAVFNRFSEECIDPAKALQRMDDGSGELFAYLERWEVDREALAALLRLYEQYRESLSTGSGLKLTDFSLLQQQAYQALDSLDGSERVFRHVIVDEYQDTNTIQERLFFKLAVGHQNICVVGDDDQALYRFRGATVENFVQFPQRCREYLGVSSRRIPLPVNYRSRKWIVDFYSDFMERCDWSTALTSDRFYRVIDKDLEAHRTDEGPSVVASSRGKPEAVFAEIAQLVRRLIDEKRVQDPNQIAFLFPSLKSVQVGRAKEALEDQGLRVYAPRAGKFLNVQEAVDAFGVFIQIFGAPSGGGWGGDYARFCDWLEGAEKRAAELMRSDRQLARFVRDRRQEIETIISDYRALGEVIGHHGWDKGDAYDVGQMKDALLNTVGLSERARRALASRYFERIVRRRIEGGRPFTLSYIVNRAASLDWNVLDLFYEICGFAHFREMFDLAENGQDEGPVCNLGLITQYLARFVDEYRPILTGDLLASDMFQRIFFLSYLYPLFRLGESEYENAEDPFPRGRIPFLTIHQSKGLEFPVVVLANPCKRDRGPQRVEQLVRPFLEREAGEPLDRMSRFDIMRMFYVALSRAKNLLVIAHLSGMYRPFKEMVDDSLPRIPDLDVTAIPPATEKDDELPKAYSYTADYLAYRRCPRRYMIYRKYGFAPARSQVMFFGSLVHQTLEDLHNYLITRKDGP
jgi:DNA helicase-2/ATP-dependent DNA helicase PcrA